MIFKEECAIINFRCRQMGKVAAAGNKTLSRSFFLWRPFHRLLGIQKDGNDGKKGLHRNRLIVHRLRTSPGRPQTAGHNRDAVGTVLRKVDAKPSVHWLLLTFLPYTTYVTTNINYHKRPSFPRYWCFYEESWWLDVYRIYLYFS